METLPQEVAVAINDFRFGTPSYWKNIYMNVVSELEDEFYHFHYVYTES